VGVSEFACIAANLAADRIEQLVATNEQLVATNEQLVATNEQLKKNCEALSQIADSVSVSRDFWMSEYVKRSIYK
jgi:cell division protein FtsB